MRIRQISEEALMSFAQIALQTVISSGNITWMTITGVKIRLERIGNQAVLSQQTLDGIISLQIPFSGDGDIQISDLSEEQKALLTYIATIKSNTKEEDAIKHLLKKITARCKVIGRKLPKEEMIELDSCFAVNHKGCLLARSENCYREVSRAELSNLDLINLNYLFHLLLEKQ